MAAAQRLRQGLRAMFSFAIPVDHTLVGTYLNADQMALFQRLQRSEQLHAVNVLMDVLQQAEETPHDLAVAALLHDTGKYRYPLRLWQKTLSVLILGAFPAWFRALSQGNPDRLLNRGPVVMVHHPEWSATLAEEHGVSARAVWLIRHHAHPPDDFQDHANHDLLVRLKTADDKN